MKRIITTLSLFLTVTALLAVPAKRGVWKTLMLNGTPTAAQLIGDEYVHYWQTADGRQLSEQADGTFAPADMPFLLQNARARRHSANQLRQRRAKLNAIGDFKHYTGQKKGLIILVEFPDLTFLPENDSMRYTRICNEQGYNEGRFCGSVYDYFRDQSYGEFELTFDVAGPVMMPRNHGYYGQNDSHGDDMHPGELVSTACLAVDSLVNFADYDWDGDGVVDQVMCIYAGEGENASGGPNTIWPHEWSLADSDYGSVLTLDSVDINTYAVANERSYSSIEGIGTICHEFSHCLGLPDMYDIYYGGNFGMGEWSVMDSGSYNGGGFCPSGYSSFDKLACGWIKPVELLKGQTVEAMQPLEDAPEAYMIGNDAFPDEYYLLENRQQRGWDAQLPGSGMLILHVDYDPEIWAWNLVNTNFAGGGEYPSNDHQRCTIVPASGKASDRASDLYPYQGNDSLTNTSSPAATLFHENLSGSRLLDKGILSIRRGADGTMSFRFRNTPEEIYLPEGTVFYESFNSCLGTGGNDNIWNTTIASSNFVSDNEGWQTANAYGGWQCARFGTVIYRGEATTPSFSIIPVDTLETFSSQHYGEALLTFKASGWNTDGATLSLHVNGEGWISDDSVTLAPFQWNTYSVRIGGSGPLSITFTPAKRFMLDEVYVISVAVDTVSTVREFPVAPLRPAGYYTPAGRYVGTHADALPHGLYILYTPDDRRGRKIIK